MATRLNTSTKTSATGNAVEAEICKDSNDIHNNGSYIAKCALTLTPEICKALAIEPENVRPVVVMMDENGRRKTVLMGLCSDVIMEDVVYALANAGLCKIIMDCNAQTDFSLDDPNYEGGEQPLFAYDFGLRGKDNISDVYAIVPIKKSKGGLATYKVIENGNLVDYKMGK